MCGINGFTWKNEDLIRKMNHLARFRGPDGSGIYVDNNASLGSTRLAIIDLSERGNQPMSNEDRSIWIVFNGEMYNYEKVREKLAKLGHEFISHGDTEVIIHAYEEFGSDCFNMFNGMWGMAIYDQRRQELLLSRDRFGVKPLYYYIDESNLVFSSMLSAFVEHDIEIEPNEKSIMEYLAFNLTQHNDQTFFAKILSLHPGHLLTYSLETRRHTISQWYFPRPKTSQSSEGLRNTFAQSVRWRTVSDVPVGVCLSGGVDSSAITCLLDKALPSDFNAFSLVAPGSRVDESRYIRAVADFTGAQLHTVEVKPDTFLEDVVDFVAAMEEPVTGLSAYAQYCVFRLAHQHGAKVLLDGQGGDELFGGYVYYWGYYFLELLKKGKLGTLAKNMFLGLRKFRQLYPFGLFLFLLIPSKIREWVWRNRLVPWVNHPYLLKQCGDEKDLRWKPLPLRELLNLTLFSTSIPHNLVWGDKSSMRWSVECREPFMDYKVVEMALALDSEDLLVDGETKTVFRNAIREDLPPIVYNRKDKIGFAAPEAEFFNHPKVIAFAEKILYSESFKARPYWNWDEIDRTFKAHRQGQIKAAELIWKWINLELWLREFFGNSNSMALIRNSSTVDIKNETVSIYN